MIRTVSDFLAEVLQKELPVLDASEIKHAPTIGDMYEGLSANLLECAIPEGLGLQVVTGFATDGLGGLSGQLDCMLVRGEGARIPFTDSFVWHVKDIIAVIEVKKTLHSAELADAWQQLSSIRALESSYRRVVANDDPDESVDIRPALRAFAETTRRVAPRFEDLDDVPVSEQFIFHALVIEQLSIIRIILGLHGFKSEIAFRESLMSLLEENIGVDGFGPGAFPQLIVSGNYSLVKANGRPFSLPLVDGEWPFCFSTPVNPLRILLELVWTRLDELFNMPGLWGEDLDIEVARALLLATGGDDGGRRGWHVRFVKPSNDQLSSVPVEEPWSPAFVSCEEFIVLQKLCAGDSVSMDDANLLTWLRESNVEPETLRENLLGTGLVAMEGREFRLIATSCTCVILPTGEYAAAEDNTGRLTRWIAKTRGIPGSNL